MPVVSHSNCPHGDHLAQILHPRVGGCGSSHDLWDLFLPGLGGLSFATDSHVTWLYLPTLSLRFEFLLKPPRSGILPF